MNPLPKKEILGVGITSATEDQILEYIFSSVKNSHEKYYVVTPNPEIVMYAQAHPEYQSVLNKAEIALCDGVGISIAGQMLDRPIKERVTGVDLLDAVCRRAAKESMKDGENAVTVGFLGAGRGVALKTSERLKVKYPRLMIGFVDEELDGKSPHVDILFVAFGFPKQEEWMAQHVGKLPVKVMMGVGGAFDYISGNVRRAPWILRSNGLEWLHRLIGQPWRLKRQLVLPQFLLEVTKARLFSQNH